MQAIRGSWSGHAVAVCASKDSGGRKSRIRRSKEERKDMVESFIKKYQLSNDGNFPSLNLTHKEVGGSFYTVREIVRDIIQENRVLAPPKVSVEEDNLLGLLGQNPLGSVSMEPVTFNSSESDQIHMEADSMANEHSEVNVSNSTTEFLEPSSLKLSSEEKINGLNKMLEREEISDGTGKSHYAMGDFSCHELKNGKIINDVDESPQNDKPVVADLSEEQHSNGPGEIIEKKSEFSERVLQESVSVEVLDREKNGVGNVEASQSAASFMSFDVVVEKFPLRPSPRTVHDEDGGHVAVETMKHKPIRHDRTTLVQSPSNFVKKDVNVHLHSKNSTASEAGVDVSSLEPKTSSLPDGTKDALLQAKNSTAHKINFETPSKSTRPETNPLVVLLKGIITTFKKFWT